MRASKPFSGLLNGSWKNPKHTEAIWRVVGAGAVVGIGENERARSLDVAAAGRVIHDVLNSARDSIQARQTHAVVAVGIAHRDLLS